MRLKSHTLLLLATTFLAARTGLAQAVRLLEEDVMIPTYLSGPPDANPMFYFGRQSQGAEGRIYPYPLYDNLTNQKGEKLYHLVYLENEYVRIGILPEIGGRLFSAVDKSNGYDFVYHQHVIKPALIGLIGAWISGGIEWNIPHHHRATTFLPVQWRTEDHPDGSKTVWVGELEIRQRMRWAVGYTLRPGRSLLECSVRILNRTPLAHSMLCFANVAVNANENYQIIFPPGTQWVTYHHKNEFASWPVARSRYRGSDFTAGVDVSWYTNHLDANSMFAWNYMDDFFAGYDHGKQAGTLSVADHHIVPGKKFWTWGSGPRGRMWDDILTDTDGPYIELMVGAYSDNQPDYSWMQPFETRTFTMNWYPFRDIGGVKNANLGAAVNLDVTGGVARFGFYTTSAHSNATALLMAADKILLEESVGIDPGHPYVNEVVLPAGVTEYDLRASLSVDGRELVAYAPVRLELEPEPPAVSPPPAPEDIENDEELFLAGQRIDQFHDAARDADPYWEEVLRRDPGNTEANTGMGQLALRRAEYLKAEGYFRKALERLTAGYTTPKDAEPFYYLGVALKAQGRAGEAVDTFHKAAWSQEWKAPACFELAQIAAARGNFEAALDFVNQSLDANALNVRAYGLKAAVLRHLGRRSEAEVLIAFASNKTDPLDVRFMAERWFLTRENAALFNTLNAHPQTAQELAAEYYEAGLWQDGIDVLLRAVRTAPDASTVSPLLYYYLGEFAARLGDTAQAADYRRMAGQQPPHYVFPFQSELIPILRRAMKAEPQDARAPYYLGNLLFDWQAEEAVALWERSVALDPNFPIAWRNLAQAHAHASGEKAQAKAIACQEKAVALPGASPTLFAELDRFYEAAGKPVNQRLAVLEDNREIVVQKDEGLARLISLKTLVGQAEESIALLSNRTFSVWEGGTAYSTGDLWANAHRVRGLQELQAGQPRKALADLEAASHPPNNLRAREQRGSSSHEAEIRYWIGCALEKLGQPEQADAAWTEAAAKTGLPLRGRRSRNVLADGARRYYRALALRQLGQNEEAVDIFNELVATGTEAISKTDPEEALGSELNERRSTRRRTAQAWYVAGLGHAGLGDPQKAREGFAAALAAAPDFLDAKIALDQLN